jgi:hypothetical protein
VPRLFCVNFHRQLILYSLMFVPQRGRELLDQFLCIAGAPIISAVLALPSVPCLS